MNYDKFFRSVYKCSYTNDVVEWYTAMMELIEFRKQYGGRSENITDISELVEEYLIEFSENKNIIVRKCWKKNEL